MAKNVGLTLSYRALLRHLFEVVLLHNKNVVEVHKLFGLMFNVIWYQRKLKETTDVDQTKQIQESVENAKSDLGELMHAWCLEYGDRDVIWALINKTV